MDRNIENTRKFYNAILKYLEPKITRYDIYCRDPILWVSVALRVFPLASQLTKKCGNSDKFKKVLELEKQLSSFKVGNRQYFLNQLVAKLRHVIEEDTGSDDYLGFLFFLQQEDYAQKPLEWYKKYFGLDDFTCEVLRSVFRGQMEIKWEYETI